MTDTYEILKANVAEAIEEALNLEEIIRTGELTDEQVERYGADSEYSDWLEVLDIIALEVYANARVDMDGDTTINEIVVVTGIGGPHVEFAVSDSGIFAQGWWGSDHADKRASGATPLLFDSLSELFQ